MSLSEPISFDLFNLNPKLKASLARLKFSTPTPIQQQAIPAALEGRDIMGLANTGTGKTFAFVLPMLERLLSNPERATRALILAPTRELVEQIVSVVRELARGTKIKATTVYGGASMGRQISELSYKPEVLVACPGRLLDHVSRRTIDLSAIEMLVLDEADQMFDMGFLPAIKEVVENIPGERQNMLFSATMPSGIKQLARDIMRDPVEVKVDTQVSAALIVHHVYGVKRVDKTPLLMRLLEEQNSDSVLVFTRTKHGAKNLAEKIYDGGHDCASLHGNLSQGRRLEALRGFRDGRYRILVATDVAARGIDVTGIGRVINFDVPETVESYIHRSGRTGRASQEGKAYSLVSEDERHLFRSIERSMKAQMVRCTLDGIDSIDLEALGGAGSERSGGRRRQFSRGGPPQRQGRSQGPRRRDDYERGDRAREERPRDGRPAPRAAEGGERSLKSDSFGNREAANRSRFEYEQQRNGRSGGGRSRNGSSGPRSSGTGGPRRPQRDRGYGARA